MSQINEDNVHILIHKTDKILKISGAMGMSISDITNRLWEAIESFEIIEEIKVVIKMPNGKKRILRKRIVRQSKNFATDIE